MDLVTEIKGLIGLRQEGAYWDFKREWYGEKHKGDLLHDIICMANNLVNRDAYIIIGVDEEQDFSIRDVRDDSNRKNTQMMVTFLRDKKFAGDVRPIVQVECCEMETGMIDVIIVRNSTNTPFYLKDKFEKVRPNHIYTRIQDSNTSCDSSADIQNVEYLWKKRFGLILSPLEKMQVYLQHPEDWVSVYDKGISVRKYYRYAPEFTIEEVYDPDDNRDAYELCFLNQIDTTPSWYDINLFYHQTMLVTMVAVGLDGGRYGTPAPEWGSVPSEKGLQYEPKYYYLEKDSIRYVVHEFYNNGSDYHECLCHNQFIDCVLVFDSKYERKEFHKYVRQHWSQWEDYMLSTPRREFSPIHGYDMEKFERQYMDTQALKRMLKDFRNENMRTTP